MPMSGLFKRPCVIQEYMYIHYICVHVQVADTATPGEFNLWVLAGRDMHQVKLSVPRVFYVNSRSAREPGGVAAAWRYVSKSLPRSVPTINLYEYSVPETTFKEHAG